MKRAVLHSMICLSFVSSFFGCGDSNLPDAYRLENFRVLALVADRPDVNPEETVNITPFVSDLVDGGGRITFSVKGCLDPGVSYGATPDCAGSPTETTIATDVELTGLTAPNYTGLATSNISVTVPPASIMFAQISEADQFNGVGYLVTIDFALPGGEMVRSFRRILVSTRATKNQNPAYNVPHLLSDGSELPSLPSQEFPLSPNLTDDSKESYEEIRSDGVTLTKEEALETSWYISNGEISLSITDDKDPTIITPAQEPPTDHDTVFVAVTRDGRGGIVATFLAL